MKQTVLVVGASGSVASEVSKNLRKLGYRVREVTSRSPQGPDQVQVDLISGSGRVEAFKGVDKAFFLSPAGYTNQDKILIPLIEEAKKNKLQKVVLMTALGANAVQESPLRKSEIALENSGLNYNIIRPNWFLQNFHTYWLHDILTTGQIQVPAHEARVSFIDARDIAASATELLNSEQYKNQSFDLTGAESVDHHALAKAISEVSGKKITYKNISPENFKSNMMKLGLSSDYADLLNGIFGFMREGYAAPVLDTVEKLTGKKPIGVLQYAQDFQAKWK